MQTEKPSEYEKLKTQIESGKVVYCKGRTAATLAELDFIVGLPDGTHDATVTVYSHEPKSKVVVVADPLMDEVGQNSQPFTPQVVEANRPDADEPGPTTIIGADSAPGPSSTPLTPPATSNVPRPTTVASSRTR